MSRSCFSIMLVHSIFNCIILLYIVGTSRLLKLQYLLLTTCVWESIYCYSVGPTRVREFLCGNQKVYSIVIIVDNFIEKR